MGDAQYVLHHAHVDVLRQVGIVMGDVSELLSSVLLDLSSHLFKRTLSSLAVMVMLVIMMVMVMVMVVMIVVMMMIMALHLLFYVK